MIDWRRRRDRPRAKPPAQRKSRSKDRDRDRDKEGDYEKIKVQGETLQYFNTNFWEFYHINLVVLMIEMSALLFTNE
jgi:hypothetical protein